MDDGAFTRLTDAAERDYFTLSQRIATVNEKSLIPEVLTQSLHWILKVAVLMYR
jgi:hypothetical protein